jgi:hypothetical protein
MWLTFLGKSTQGGGSPTLYLTDRDTYVVQGWSVAGKSSAIVEIPESLLRYLEPGTRLGVPLTSTGRRWRGDDGEWATYTVAGDPVTDPDAIAQMNLPDHEVSVEVDRARKDDRATAPRPGVR